MSICIYGDIGIDWLVEDVSNIDYRWGGAGLYAALASARQGANVNLLTIYGPELLDYVRGYWNDLGISLEFAQFYPALSLPKYIVTGFGQYGRKKSRPLTEVKLDIQYNPNLPIDCKALLVFPINHSLPLELLTEAKKRNIPIFLDPKPNELSIADARRLISFATCLLVNEEEAQKLTNKSNISDAIASLKQLGIPQIIVKQGIRGCFVIDEKQEDRVSAFKSRAKCTLGSGDVFGGTLITSYFMTKNLIYSVKLACCAAANFIEQCETEAILSREAVLHDMEVREQIDVPDVSRQSVYLAGPFFSHQELQWVNNVCNALEDTGFKVHSPSRDNGIITELTPPEERQKIFQKDISLLEQVDIVVSLLDHNDSGTHFEVGYAHKMGIPVFALKTSTEPLNNMLQYGCTKICTSLECLIEELYEHFKK